MNFFSISSVLVTIVSILMGVFVIVKGKKTASYIWAIFCFTVSIWGIAGYNFSVTTFKDTAFFWWQIAYVSVILTPVFYYHFVLSFIEKKEKYHNISLFVVYLLGGIFIVFNLFFRNLFLGDLRFVFNQFYWMHPTIHTLAFWVFYICFYWILLGYAFLLLIRDYFRSKGLRRSQLKYLILGSLIAWLGPEGDYLVAFGFDIYPYSNFLIIVYPIIIGYAIIKYHLLDIRVAITRTGIFVFLYAIVLGIPFYTGHALSGGFHREWVVPTTLAVFFATCGYFLYRILQKKAEDIILAKQRHYQRLLMQAARGMVREHNLERLVKLIAYIVKKTVGVRFAAVFLYNKDRKLYELKAYRSYKLQMGYITFEEDSDAVNYIKEHRMPFIYEEMPEEVRAAVEKNLGTNFALVVPAERDGNLLGFLILGDKLDKSAYSEDDINVFKILSNQASLAIENCLFFEEFRKAQNRIFEAEKLASIGGMAEGVAHQIKNRLNHFSVISGELKLELTEFVERYPELANDERLKEVCSYVFTLADSLLENVKRTNDVVQGILNYARTSAKETYFSYFSLREVIQLSLDLLKVKHRISVFPLEQRIEDGDMIYGIKAQVMESIYNILDNAYEATQEKREILASEHQSYTPQIVITSRENSLWYIIEISDNGIGIKDEDKPKIFAPFFTTKSSYRPVSTDTGAGKSGTGIGMYVVRRMIEENHKGKIWFESEYMKGTTFYIKLPKKPVST